MRPEPTNVVPMHGPIVNTLVLLRDWDRFLAAQQFSPATRRNYRGGMLRFLMDACPDDFGEVSEDHITAWLSSQPPRSPVQTMYARGVKSFFAWAHRRGYLPSDPTAAVKPKKPSHPPVASLSDEELTRLLVAAAWREERRAWALMLQYSLGARRSEVVGLARADVDLEGRMAILRHTKYNRPREIELGRLALAALEGLQPWGRETIIGIMPQVLTEWARHAAVEAGLGKARNRSSHILRATFATNLLNRGIPVQVVAELLGHVDIKTTARYLATTRPQRREAVELL